MRLSEQARALLAPDEDATVEPMPSLYKTVHHPDQEGFALPLWEIRGSEIYKTVHHRDQEGFALPLREIRK